MTEIKKRSKQVEKMLKELQCAYRDQILERLNLNIVTCGMCGTVFIHSMTEEELDCPYCDFTSDPGDFPDLILNP